MTILDDKPWFPPPEFANEDGLLAIGGDLTIERLLLAYRSGVFPWYNDDVPLWWHPNPRFVLYPKELKISKSMKQIIKNEEFVFTTNTAFKQVIINCQKIFRKNQEGTWINKDVIESYTTLHILGVAHSAEAWFNNELVGGLYGIKMGKVFFGESMFSHKSNASKFAFIKYLQMLIEEGVELIDCQIYSEHLESLGARMIDRDLFMQILKANIPPTAINNS